MALPITEGLHNWQFQRAHVEKDLDTSAINAAHPDDTLVFAGPVRKPASPDTLLPIGMLQQISFQQGKQTQPLMSIGGGRAFFTSGKSQTSWSAARLFVNGRNFLRALHDQAIKSGIDVTAFDDKAGAAQSTPAGTGDANQPKYVVNLDSELFYLPFGMGCMFRNKQRQICGAFYMEACMISSWSTAIGAGQSQIMEQVSGMADRILPWKVSGGTTPTNLTAITELNKFTSNY